MNPNFASLVDPIILKVLALVDKVRQDEGTTPPVERQLLERAFRESEAKSSDGQAWSLAKYALACWVDDLLISIQWPGREWWEGNSLEFAFFNTHDRATQFFVKADEASQLPRRDALEVYYLCVVLGFRGLYSLEEATVIADHLDLPITLAEWVRNTAAAIQLRQGRPSFQEEPQQPSGAPPLESRYLLVGALLWTTVLAVLLLLLLWLNKTFPKDHPAAASLESIRSATPASNLGRLALKQHAPYPSARSVASAALFGLSPSHTIFGAPVIKISGRIESNPTKKTSVLSRPDIRGAPGCGVGFSTAMSSRDGRTTIPPCPSS